MVYAEICAGVGGGSLGLHRAGFRAAWLNEINTRTADVLRARFPDVPIYESDATTLCGRTLVAAHGPVDLLMGGTPCQDLSMAGQRKGLHGEKSIIFYQLIRLWHETEARYALWENVAGALHSNHGRDFASVLSAFVGAPITVPRTRWRRSGVAAGPHAVAAWRLLDAQYFGVPQRRKRIFVLAARAGGVDPAQVLLESEGLCGNPATSPSTRQTGPTTLGARTATLPDDSRTVAAFDLGHITRPGEQRRIRPNMPTPTLLSEGRLHVIPDIAPTLTAHYAKGGDLSMDLYILSPPAIAFHACQDGTTAGTIAPTLLAHNPGRGDSGSGGSMGVLRLSPVGRPRRLLPIECERLMGWPDGWTDVRDRRNKPSSDTFRYRACGNGIVSTVTQWIGGRLLMLHR